MRRRRSGQAVRPCQCWAVCCCLSVPSCVLLRCLCRAACCCNVCAELRAAALPVPSCVLRRCLCRAACIMMSNTSSAPPPNFRIRGALRPQVRTWRASVTSEVCSAIAAGGVLSPSCRRRTRPLLQAAHSAPLAGGALGPSCRRRARPLLQAAHSAPLAGGTLGPSCRRHSRTLLQAAYSASLAGGTLGPSCRRHTRPLLQAAHSAPLAGGALSPSCRRQTRPLWACRCRECCPKGACSTQAVSVPQMSCGLYRFATQGVPSQQPQQPTRNSSLTASRLSSRAASISALMPSRSTRSTVAPLSACGAQVEQRTSRVRTSKRGKH
eukprot:355302-Chlamydomonas_euryale.AAC.17